MSPIHNSRSSPAPGAAPAQISPSMVKLKNMTLALMTKASAFPKEQDLQKFCAQLAAFSYTTIVDDNAGLKLPDAAEKQLFKFLREFFTQLAQAANAGKPMSKSAGTLRVELETLLFDEGVEAFDATSPPPPLAETLTKLKALGEARAEATKGDWGHMYNNSISGNGKVFHVPIGGGSNEHLHFGDTYGQVPAIGN